MANDATISLVGRVSKEPSQKQINGTTVLNLNLSVSTTKKAEPGAKYPYLNDYYDVSVWGKTAEYLLGKVNVGSSLWVTGEFMVGEPWKDREGREHTSLRVTASKVKILGSTTRSNNTVTQTVNEIMDEEAPF